MHLYFLDENVKRLSGPHETYLSLSFREHFTRTGDFSLTLPMSDAPLLKDAAYLLLAGEDAPPTFEDGRRTLGRIERTVYDSEKMTVTVSGRLCESLLSERYIALGTHEEGPVKWVIERVLTQNGVSSIAGFGTRAIAHLGIEGVPHFLDETGNHIQIDEYPGGQVLEDWLRALLARYGASYRITYDENSEDAPLKLSIYQPKDRRASQSENSPVIFSSSQGTLGSVTLSYDTSLYKNYAFVAGRGEGAERVTLEVDLRDGDEERRELYLDARSLSVGDDDAPNETYLARLRKYAEKKLRDHRRIVQIKGTSAPLESATVLPIAAAAPYAAPPLVFSLGDLCDIALDVPPMTVSERITAIELTARDGCVMRRALFGAEYPIPQERSAP